MPKTESLSHEFAQIECVYGGNIRDLCKKRVEAMSADEEFNLPQMTWEICQEVYGKVFSAPESATCSEMYYD